MARYEAKDVQEAVDLAFSFREKGTYRWFRGQRKEEWVPRASLFRLPDEAAVARNTRRLHMFYRWLSDVPQLQYLQDPDQVHQLCAILQHYGVATAYLDFTTNPGVAGFFAADNGATEDKGCIFCLDPEDLMSFWKLMQEAGGREGRRIELVEVDVSNLWRLQAQEGRFIFSDYNWEIDYDMDCIVFPQSGCPAAPTAERIYPTHKSALELLLDQYFEIERVTFAHENFVQDVEQRRRAGRPSFHMTQVVPPPDAVHAGAFKDVSALTLLPSWQPQALAAWRSHPQERFENTVGRALRIQLSGKSPASLGEAVSFAVRQYLRSTPRLRDFAIDWVVEGAHADLPLGSIGTDLQCVWNGMRQLPFTDEDVALALGNTMRLLAAGYRGTQESHLRDACAAECFKEDVLEVGFDAQDGSGSRGRAGVTALQEALRPDMHSLLKEEHAGAVESICGLFSMVYNPRLMFDFAQFARIFATHVIPTQVLEKRSLILFNPAQIRYFGNI